MKVGTQPAKNPETPFSSSTISSVFKGLVYLSGFVCKFVLTTSKGVKARCTEDIHRAPAAKKRRIMLVVNFFSLSIGLLPLGPKSSKR